MVRKQSMEKECQVGMKPEKAESVGKMVCILSLVPV